MDCSFADAELPHLAANAAILFGVVFEFVELLPSGVVDDEMKLMEGRAVPLDEDGVVEIERDVECD